MESQIKSTSSRRRLARVGILLALRASTFLPCGKLRLSMNHRLTLASIVLTLLLGLIAIRQFMLPAPKTITPTLTNQPELCLTCHDGIEEISPAHPVEAFGCVICHGGNALALDENLAHAGLRGGKNPADFSVVEASCGGAECHSGTSADQRDHIQR